MFVDDARDIDPAAGPDQEQAFLALSGSVSGSTFLECCETIRLNSMGRKPSECTLAALPENPWLRAGTTCPGSKGQSEKN